MKLIYAGNFLIEAPARLLFKNIFNLSIILTSVKLIYVSLWRKAAIIYPIGFMLIIGKVLSFFMILNSIGYEDLKNTVV